jgi:hypothetical protein
VWEGVVAHLITHSLLARRRGAARSKARAEGGDGAVADARVRQVDLCITECSALLSSTDRTDGGPSISRERLRAHTASIGRERQREKVGGT